MTENDKLIKAIFGQTIEQLDWAGGWASGQRSRGFEGEEIRKFFAPKLDSQSTAWQAGYDKGFNQPQGTIPANPY